MNPKNREQLLIVLTVAAVALLAGDRFVIEPLIASWKQRNADIAALQKKVQMLF